MQGTPGQRYSRWGSTTIITAPGTPVNIFKTVNLFGAWFVDNRLSNSPKGRWHFSA